MNKTLNNLIIFNGYPLAVVVAIGLHVFLILGLVLLQGNSQADELELVQPTVVKALFIDENPQVRNQRIIEQRRIQRAEEQRQAELQRQRAEEEARRQAEAERQRREEEQRQAAIRERETLERQRAEQARLERERQQREQDLREAEQQRQRELAEAERRRREAEAQQARQQAETAAAEAARNEFELVQSATGLIQQLVQNHWSRPPSARNGMRAVIQIRMLPTGELLDATITESSGDAAFDRSAENAVYRAAPFSELQDLPINVFNNNFRSLSLIFEPQDLLN